MTDRIFGWALVAAFVIAVIAFGLIALVLINALGNDQRRIESFSRQCVESNGHIYGSGLYLCLDPEGRVIEVYP